MNLYSILILKYSLSQEKEVVYRKLFKAALNCLVLSDKFLISQGEIVGNLDVKVIASCLICC